MSVEPIPTLPEGEPDSRTLFDFKGETYMVVSPKGEWMKSKFGPKTGKNVYKCKMAITCNHASDGQLTYHPCLIALFWNTWHYVPPSGFEDDFWGNLPIIRPEWVTQMENALTARQAASTATNQGGASANQGGAAANQAPAPESFIDLTGDD